MRVDINFGFASVRLSLVLLSHFPGVASMCLYEKNWLEKTVISYGNVNPKEIFNIFHKLKPLSLNSLERIRNWKKKFLDSHSEGDANEFLWGLAWCYSQWISGKSLSSVPVLKRALPSLRHTQLQLTSRSHLPPGAFRSGRSSRSMFWHRTDLLQKASALM